MSVLIKGMKMPDCCNNCEFHWEEDVSFEIMHQCQVKTGYIDNADTHSFPYDCPLVELPEKHGRLVEFIDVATETNDDTGLEEINLGEALSAYLKMRESKPVIESEGE